MGAKNQDNNPETITIPVAAARALIEQRLNDWLDITRGELLASMLWRNWRVYNRQRLMKRPPKISGRDSQLPKLDAEKVDFAGGVSVFRQGGTARDENKFPMLFGVVRRHQSQPANMPSGRRVAAHHAMRDSVPEGVFGPCCRRSICWSPRARLAGLPAKANAPSIPVVFVAVGARMVAKIIAGTPPSDIPVEQPSEYPLAVNLETARRLGITLPPTLLARADKIIE